MWTTFGIEPEEIDYSTMKIIAPGYELRPEIIESAYYLHHFTDNPRYLDMGQTFPDSLVKYCRTDVGFAALPNVETKEKRDDMESFFLAETLKYLYLLFTRRSRRSTWQGGLQHRSPSDADSAHAVIACFQSSRGRSDQF